MEQQKKRMMQNGRSKTILAISGSTRRPSTNETILKLAGTMLPPGVELELYPGIDLLPWFNPDLDSEGAVPPEPVRDLRARILRADGVLICTPEYVFSLPGALKNALEWTVSTTVFSEKPVAYIVASASGEKAFESLGLILGTLVQHPLADDCKLLIRGSRGKVREGAFTDESALSDLQALLEALLLKMRQPASIS